MVKPKRRNTVLKSNDDPELRSKQPKSTGVEAPIDAGLQTETSLISPELISDENTVTASLPRSTESVQRSSKAGNSVDKSGSKTAEIEHGPPNRISQMSSEHIRTQREKASVYDPTDLGTQMVKSNSQVRSQVIRNSSLDSHRLDKKSTSSTASRNMRDRMMQLKRKEILLKAETEKRHAQVEAEKLQKQAEADAKMNEELLRAERQYIEDQFHDDESIIRRGDQVEEDSDSQSDMEGITNESLRRTEDWVKEQTHDETGQKKNVVRNTEFDKLDKLTEVITGLVQRIPMSHAQDNVHELLTRQSIGKDLPLYDGNKDDWILFVFEFLRTSELCQFTNSENLIRLQKCLRGEAKEAVKTLLLCPENVPKILNVLEERFGDPRVLVRKLIHEAREMKTVGESSPGEFIKFSTEVRNISEMIKLIGSKTYSEHPELVEIMNEKLPFMLKYEWGKHFVKKYGTDFKGFPTIDDFSAWTENVAKIMKTITYSDTKERKYTDHGRRKHEKTFTTSEKPHEKRWPCMVCNGTHGVFKCGEFLDMKVGDRWEIVKQKRLCFSCLVPGHSFSNCRTIKKCTVKGCEKTHNTLLHNEEKKPHRQDKATLGTEDKVELTAHSKVQFDHGEVLLRIIPVKVYGPNKIKTVYAMFDEASTVTLMENELAHELGLKGTNQPLCIQWTNGIQNEEKNSKKVSVQISGIETQAKIFKMEAVRTVDNLSLPKQTVNVTKMGETWNYVKNLGISNYTNIQPTILIGQDNIKLTIARRVLHGKRNEPVVSKTWLGWVVHGSLPKKLMSEPASFSFHLCEVRHPEDNTVHQMIEDSFKMESYGVVGKSENPRSQEDCNALLYMEENTQRVGSRFETRLLWKDEKCKTPRSYDMALKRLLCTENKMKKNSEYADLYCTKIEEYVQKGFLKKVTKLQKSDRTWYLPHFGVSNPNKPGKFRLVFDAAAKVCGKSLNDYLMTGPDLLQPLPAVLFKFRQHPIAFVGDIQEMFHQVLIKEEDKPSQRILWRGKSFDNRPDIYEMQVMMFGSVCSPSCAQYVKNLNANEYSDKFPRATKAIVENHYVDDYLDSVETVDEARQLVKEVSLIHERGGFHMRNWVSNSDAALSEVNQEDKVSRIKNIDQSEGVQERVLGLAWNANKDMFTFELKFHKIEQSLLKADRRPTKREFLRIVMSIFDPLGFVSHLTIKARILMQSIWKEKIGWDETIPLNLFARWKVWLSEVEKLKYLQIPRYYSKSISKASNIQLHVFCDASEKAYSTVGYLRFRIGNDITVQLVMSRAKVAPVKAMTIPRLELQAAVMGSRLCKYIRQNHEYKIDEVIMWSDSRTVLSWIKIESRRFKPFVSNRVAEICENTNVDTWRWVPTKDNPADDATRNEKLCDLSNTSRWINGPEFLYNDADDWPTIPKEKCELEDDNNENELKKEEKVFLIHEIRETVIDPSRFSNWNRMVRTLSWAQRFINNCRNQERNINTFISIDELRRSENILLKMSQRQSFYEELHQLESSRCVMKNSRLKCLTPYVDEDGILRVLGRLRNSELLSDYTKHPAILEPTNHITLLLMKKYHEEAFHQMPLYVMNELRQKYWIINLRQNLKKLSSNCMVCRKRRAKPIIPLMSDLPACRITPYKPAFYYTGMDYFGPIITTVGRRNEKRYGVIFTCMNSRAVHLELAHSLNTHSAINAIRRFISRRGKPYELYSDNGTNLRGADTELKKAIQQIKPEDMKDDLALRGINWKFIPPRAPHFGGSWERLIGMVKKILNSMLHLKKPTDETLTTFLAETENILNSRPITVVSSNNDEPEALTPNHLLLGKSSGQCSPGVFTDKDDIYTNSWKAAQRLADEFWNRWSKEYLPTLNLRRKWNQEKQPLQINDIVFVADDFQERNTWPLGKIVETFKGKDGRIRTAEVKTTFGNYIRPVTKLFRFETEETEK